VDTRVVTTRGLTGLLAVALLALAGCGDAQEAATGGTTTSRLVPSETSDEAAARSALIDFYEALARGEGQQVCETFTEPNRREMGGPGGSPAEQIKRCAAQVEREFKGTPSPTQDRFTKIEVVGNEATIDIAGSPSTGEGGNAVLKKLGGVWRVDAY
jgi:hypothetical protein